MVRSIAIIGASNDQSKFGNKAVRAYKKAGWVVYPINPKESNIEGLRCYPSILNLPKKPNVASLYVPASVGEKILDDIATKGVKEVFVNPGAESDSLIQKAKSLGLELRLVCSILAIGEHPDNY